MRSLAAALLLVLVLAPLGCGGGHDDQVPPGPLAAALSEIGGGGEHGSLGVGWTEPTLARRLGIGPRLMATALAPNAETLIEEAPELRRRFRFDPLAAERLISIGGSYAFGLRIDGLGASGLRLALIRAGGRTTAAGPPELVEVGDYAQVPDPLLRAGVLGLGARDAFGPAMTVLAISESSRDSLLGRGGRLIDQPVYRAAADCLGQVGAARMIPDKLLLSTDLGVELVAAGIARQQEVLCLLGGSDERAREIADNLRGSLAPGARDPRIGEPMSALIGGAEVSVGSYQGVPVVRAAITPVGGRPSGFLFAAIARGTLVPLVNGT